MRTLFVDTFYFVALLRQTDQAHGMALAMAKAPHTRKVTTRWVLAELANAMSEPGARRLCSAFIERLTRDPDYEIIEESDRLFAMGYELYRQRPDKGWSLTDCISFAVMDEYRLSEALTGDRHFEQAGFLALLRGG